MCEVKLNKIIIKKGYISNFIEKTYTGAYISTLLVNRLITNVLRNKGILEKDSDELRIKYDNFEQKLDSTYQEFISSETVNNFKQVTNTDLYTLSNIKKNISYNSFKSIYNYLRSNPNIDDSEKNNTESDGDIENNVSNIESDSDMETNVSNTKSDRDIENNVSNTEYTNSDDENPYSTMEGQ